MAPNDCEVTACRETLCALVSPSRPHGHITGTSTTLRRAEGTFSGTDQGETGLLTQSLPEVGVLYRMLRGRGYPREELRESSKMLCERGRLRLLCWTLMIARSPFRGALRDAHEEAVRDDCLEATL
jgi:hypothetical protein